MAAAPFSQLIVRPRNRVWIAARSIAVGWLVMLAISYLIERPLVAWITHWLGGSWYPTTRGAFDCLTLAATGWTIGNFHRSAPLLGVLAFAVTLAFWDLDPFLSLNVPWLIRLAADTIEDSLYFDSLLGTAGLDALLFGSLIVGSLVSRPLQKPVSILVDR